MSELVVKSSTASPAAARLLPYAALFGGMLSLAVGTSFAKHLFPVIGAQGTTAYRVGLAAVMLVLLWRPWRFRLTRHDLTAVALYGVATGVMNLCFYLSLRTIPLGIAIAVEFTGPLVLALISARRLEHVLWIVLAGLGLLLLLPIDGGAAALDPKGLLLAGAAGVCWALYIVFGKRLSHIHPGQSVSLGMSVAALVVVPFGIAHAGPALLSPAIALAALGVAIASSAVPYSLEMYAMRHIPKRTFGVVLSVEPVFGAIAGLLFLHEQLSGRQWIAVAAIVAASAGAVLSVRRPDPPPVVA
ncbi:MAG: EamA family transporter [Phenylobacterium zucineum]|nr:MAG: EamA family transporter [Phenylobacterium zucineum]